MTQYVKDAGVWKPVKQGYVKDAGVWKPAASASIKDTGVWKPFGYLTPLQNPAILGVKVQTNTPVSVSASVSASALRWVVGIIGCLINSPSTILINGLTPTIVVSSGPFAYFAMQVAGSSVTVTAGGGGVNFLAAYTFETSAAMTAAQFALTNTRPANGLCFGHVTANGGTGVSITHGADDYLGYISDFIIDGGVNKYIVGGAYTPVDTTGATHSSPFNVSPGGVNVLAISLPSI